MNRPFVSVAIIELETILGNADHLRGCLGWTDVRAYLSTGYERRLRVLEAQGFKELAGYYAREWGERR